jgi:hypothetical protein
LEPSYLPITTFFLLNGRFGTPLFTDNAILSGERAIYTPVNASFELRLNHFETSLSLPTGPQQLQLSKRFNRFIL